MKVKVFEAETMTLALKKVKEQLGPNALILSTRTLRRKKKLGFWSKSYVELTAAVDRNRTEETSFKEALNLGQDAGQKTKTSTSNHQMMLYDKSGAVKTEPKGDSKTEEPKTLTDNTLSENIHHLKAEMRELRQTVQDIVSQKNEEKRKHKQESVSQIPACSSQTHSLCDTYPFLQDLGLHHDFVEQLIQRAQASLSEKELKDPATVWHFIQKSLADWIHVYDAIFNGGVQKKRIAMIGPTGVGKTTTLAKLAAQYMLYKNTNIAMVTIDHYRIAAVEQLKVYGEIMNIPVEVAFTCEELGNILNDYRHKDLILIDTAGRSPRNSQEMEELRSILTPFDTIEGHLVLSATTREEELFDILKSFHILSPKSTIFTKLDECDFLGSILNVHLCHDYPISYLANGQRVPEDLVFAEPRVITELVMKSTKGQDL